MQENTAATERRGLADLGETEADHSDLERDLAAGATDPRPAALQARADGDRTVTDFSGMRLVGEDLAGLDLSGCDFSDSDLSSANLAGTNLTAARLVGAVFFRATMTGASFWNADLTGANCGESIADDAAFGGATLCDASFFGANLSRATLTEANLSGADLRAATLDDARLGNTDLSGADLSRASLQRVDIGGSAIAGTNLSGADLRGAQLRGITHFEKAHWIAADLREVDFCGAYMVRRWIMDANYIHEFRTRSRLTEYLYRLWWLTSDCGRSFGRWALWTLLVGFLFGAVYSTLAIDYGSYPTALSPFYYSFVTLTTLGYGDAVPASAVAQAVAVLEVIIGYVALGGMLSIFANKMARRAE